MIVKVAPMGGRVVEVNVESGETVARVLEIAGVDIAGRSIRVNNIEATEDTTVTAENSIVMLAQKMKGGR